MMPGLIVDNFAGGGGASTGIELALHRAIDIAINHDAEAVAMHLANHPDTVHYCQSVYSVDPLEVTGGRHVDLAWFSPDCKHFSKAKGGKPVEKGIRDLAMVAVHWVERLQKSAKAAGNPNWRQIIRVIMLENVEEFRKWGPLGVDGRPIKEREGEEFQLFLARFKRLGGRVEFKELRACDYGTPTSRKRLFMVIRFDGLPIIWPEPSHGKPGTPEVESGKRLPWRTAAECIDWSIPCPSIFERKKDLKDATCRRIAAGIMRYVVNSKKPFIVPITHTKSGDRFHSMENPLNTVTTAKGGEFAVVSPTFVPLTHQGDDQRAYDPGEPIPTVTGANRGEIALVSATIVGCGGRRAQSGPVDMEGPYPTTTAKADACIVSAFLHKYRRNNDGQSLDGPMPTVTANSFIKRPGGAPPLAICAVHLAQHNTMPNGGLHPGRSVEDPRSTVTATGAQQAVVASSIVKLRGTCRDGQPTDEPLHTISAGGMHFAEVQAFLIKYYGNEADGHSLRSPLGTVTTLDRFGLVIVTIEGEEYAIVDIGMRMLSPRELARAQGFPDDYIICPEFNGKPMTKTAQIRMIGNSVCPPMSEALVRANLPTPVTERKAA
jgi:DNA (cytosine-5)-methyltransferase 1